MIFNISVALGIGLLIGAERERRKGDGPLRRSAGILLLLLLLVLVLVLVLISITLPALLPRMLLPLVLGVGIGLTFAMWKIRANRTTQATENVQIQGHAFDLKTCLLLALALLGVTVMTAGLNQAWGTPGAQISAVLAGFVDAHTTVATMFGLLEQSLISQSKAHVCIWLAVSSNSLSKALMAIFLGGKPFAMQFLPGLLAIITAVWASLLAQSWLFGL